MEEALALVQSVLPKTRPALTNDTEDPNGSGLTSEDGLVGALKEGDVLTYSPGEGWTVTPAGGLQKPRKGLLAYLRGR